MNDTTRGHSLSLFFTAFFAVGLVCLLMAYVYKNQIKLAWTLKKVEAVAQGNSAAWMSLRHNGEAVVRFALPTSDIMDASGTRGLNFRYLSQEAWQEFSQTAQDADIYFNGKPYSQATIERHERAIAFTFPEKKLYVLAPPHSGMFAKVVQYERKRKQDIFFCTGSPSFCDHTKIVDFGGMSALKERVLEKDAFADTYVLPRGRWATYMVQLEIMSKRVQTATVIYRMAIPFASQDAMVSEPEDAILFMKNPAQQRVLTGMGIPTQPFVVKVELPLKVGANRVTVMLAKMTEESVQIPYSLTGVMQRIEISGTN